MTEMVLRELDDAQLEALYASHMQHDFPQNELKRLSRLYELKRRGLYRTTALYAGEKLCAYAMFSGAPDCPCLLLDYFAVDPALRGKGIGTQALQVITDWAKDQAQGILIEAENPDFARTLNERRTRIRRMNFYRHCGAKLTGYRLWLYFVDYCVFYLAVDSVSRTDAYLQKAQAQIYRAQFTQQVYDTRVRFY